MVGEWREASIGELAEIFDGPHATPPKTDDGPVFLGISNLAQGRLDLSSVEHLSEEDHRRWTRRVEPKPGNVVFSYETRLGEAALIPPNLRCCLGRRMGLLRARPAKVDDRFLLYAYLGPRFQETLRSRTVHGSTVDRIPLTDMPGFPIQVPLDIKEQRAIAHILGTLDDKIELNRRMNETLEAMARALFKSWFVDFDPVRAKAEGRDPGLPGHLADLFPDGFEDSELGEIPKGWEVGPIGDVAELTIGGDWGMDNPFGGAVEGICLRGVDLERLRDDGRADAPRRWFRASSVDKRQLNASDVLVAGSGAGPTGRSLWANAQLNRLWHLPVVYSNFCKRLRCRSEDYAVYLDRCLLSMRESGEIWEYVNGTSVPNLDAESLLSGRAIVRPDEGVLRYFARFNEQVAQRLFSQESHTLAALRDTLLPKLVSGQLRVKDAERFVQEATA
jgi:type I restriction enzyme S subunit